MNGEQFFDLLTPIIGAEITNEYRTAAHVEMAVDDTSRDMTVKALFRG